MTTDVVTDQNRLSEEFIREFQKNLTEHVESVMKDNEKEIGDNIHDFYLKSLDERINEYLITLEQNGETLHVSTQGEEYFSEVMGKYIDSTDNINP